MTFHTSAPYPYGKEKETREFIFSWLSWLTVWLIWACIQDDNGGHGAVMQDGSHTPANRLTETCMLIF